MVSIFSCISYRHVDGRSSPITHPFLLSWSPLPNIDSYILKQREFWPKTLGVLLVTSEGSAFSMWVCYEVSKNENMEIRKEDTNRTKQKMKNKMRGGKWHDVPVHLNLCCRCFCLKWSVEQMHLYTKSHCKFNKNTVMKPCDGNFSNEKNAFVLRIVHSQSILNSSFLFFFSFQVVSTYPQTFHTPLGRLVGRNVMRPKDF